MKATIVDVEALKEISPSALVAFARAEGWSRVEAYGKHADVYVGDSRPEIIIPRTDRVGDYASIVSRLVEIFSEFTNNDELATYRELIGAAFDVIRVRSRGNDDDGTISLNSGVEIVAQARDMLLAAACATRSPQPFYRAGANREATEYMGRVRLGQTEHGSYVVTLLAPVPMQLAAVQSSLDTAWVAVDEEPIERMVTRRLMSALEASRTAAEMALSGDEKAFENAVAKGVSANLCEAVAKLIENSRGLDVSMTWARTRPRPEVHERVSFSEKDAEILKEAARTFRLRQTREGITLFGTVHKLKRDQMEREGLITVKAMVDDKPQSVSALLDENNYSTAVSAHDAKRPVIITGDLKRTGQRWQMTNANVSELPADDGPED